jgi:hypothetical protein
MRTLYEFGIMTVIISALAGGGIAFLPLFTIWTVLPVFAFAIALHLGHGFLYSTHLVDALEGHPKQARVQTALKKVTWSCIAITTVVLILVTASRAVVAG